MPSPVDFLEKLLPAIEHAGGWGYWIAFLFSFTEAVAIIGSVVPGALSVIFFGFLASQGYFDLAYLLAFVSLGAILGDSFSYYLGTKGTRYFKNEGRLLRAEHLEKGRAFFAAHGNKSILLGRFISPLRSIVPFVAGVAHMNRRTFLFWNIVGGIAWAAAHLLLGYFFGGALSTVDLWLGRIGLFLGGVIIFSILLWALVHKSGPFWRFLGSLTHDLLRAVARNEGVRAALDSAPGRFLARRFDRRSFFGLPVTLLSLAFLYALGGSLGLLQDIITSAPILSLDLRLENLLSYFRDAELVRAFLVVTALGTWPVALAAALAASGAFLAWRKRVYFYALWLALSGSAAFALLEKMFVHRPRPSGSIPFYHEGGLSFPSGHATTAVALYGFLTYAALRHLRGVRAKTAALFTGLFVIVMLGFSRMYLGVHYVSDVLGGYLLGALWLIIGIAVVEWHLSRDGREAHPAAKNAKAITVVLIGAALVFYGSFAASYRPAPLPLRAHSERVFAGNDVLDLFAAGGLPRSTEGFFGKREEPVSIIFIAKDAGELERAFSAAGWFRAEPITAATLFALVRAAMTGAPYPTAPMTPAFWDSKVHAFGFEKPTATDSLRSRHHARVWRTGFVTPSGARIYVATASLDVGYKWFVTHRISPDLDTERETLYADLARTGFVAAEEKVPFVEPTIGKNLTGDQFFTDGKAYVLTIR